jgi:hypothetical protein
MSRDAVRAADNVEDAAICVARLCRAIHLSRPLAGRRSAIVVAHWERTMIEQGQERSCR